MPPTRRLPAPLRFLLALLFLSPGHVAADPEPAPPRVAISPIIPPGADEGLDLGRTLADLLAVHLSDSDAWTLVERADLPAIEDEWLLKSSALAGRAASLRTGALARADLVLECHVDPATAETPYARIIILDTARAEVLAELPVALTGRPNGPWYRSPPAADAETLARTARLALEQACTLRASWGDRPVAALLFAVGDTASTPRTEAVLAHLAAAAGQAGYRWVNTTPGRAAENESLLQLLGLVNSDRSPWATAAELYFWITAAGDEITISAWRPGHVIHTTRILAASTDTAPTLALIQTVSPTDSATPGTDPDTGRLAVAREFLAEARRLWRPLKQWENIRPLELENWRTAPPAKQPALAHIRTLLDAAAFFAPEDAEIQELRLVVAARLAEGVEKQLLVQRYCEIADRFWRRPDDTLDARLLVESHRFRFIPFAFAKRRIPAAAAVLTELPSADLVPFAPMLETWVRGLCGYGKDETSLALLETVWPLAARALGDSVHRAPDENQLDLATTVRLASPAWQARILPVLRAHDAVTRAPAPTTPPSDRIRSSERPRLGPPAASAPNASSRPARAITPPPTPRSSARATPTTAAEAVAALRRGDTAILANMPLTSDILTARDERAWTVLHHALNQRAEDFALRLVAAGAPHDALTAGGQSPLAFAAANRLESCVAALLAAGAAVDLRVGSAPTALYQAAYSQNPRLVRRLLDAGADLAVRVDDDRSTVVHAAASRADNVPVLETLLAAGADFHALTATGRTALDWTLGSNAHQNVAFLHARGVTWRRRDSTEPSPLHYAAREGQGEMVRALLDIGLWDDLALSAAASPAIRAQLEDAAVKRGSNIVDDLALWPVICADRINWRRRVEAHLTAGGNVNFTPASYAESTPLEHALSAMNPDLVRLLIERSAVPRTHRELTPVTHPPTLWRVLAPMWLSHPKLNMPDFQPPFETTLEEWDTYAADMIALIAARWPDPAYAKLHAALLKSRQPRAAAALAAAGFVSAP